MHGLESDACSSCRLRSHRCRRACSHRATSGRQRDGRLVGVPRRQDRAGRDAGTDPDTRAQGGTGNSRQRGLSRTAHFREPSLPRLSSSDAALCLPALGGDGHSKGSATARLGEAEPAAGLCDAAGRRAAGISPDGAALDLDRGKPRTEWA